MALKGLNEPRFETSNLKLCKPFLIYLKTLQILFSSPMLLSWQCNVANYALNWIIRLKETNMDNKTSRHKNNLYDKCSYCPNLIGIVSEHQYCYNIYEPSPRGSPNWNLVVKLTYKTLMNQKYFQNKLNYKRNFKQSNGIVTNQK